VRRSRPAALLSVALAFGPATCALPPAPSDAASTAASGLSLRLQVPGTVSAAADNIPVRAMLTNRGDAPRRLSVATPCDVHAWIIADARGNEVMREPPEICAQVIAEVVLAPGETVAADASIGLPHGLLKPGAAYVIRYRFWGQPAAAEFQAR
jgi:hypothetical protein